MNDYVMLHRGAAEQVLETLEHLPIPDGYVVDVDDAVIALRDALEQQKTTQLLGKQKPLARSTLINLAAEVSDFDKTDFDTIFEPFARSVETMHGIVE